MNHLPLAEMIPYDNMMRSRIKRGGAAVEKGCDEMIRHVGTAGRGSTKVYCIHTW